MSSAQQLSGAFDDNETRPVSSYRGVRTVQITRLAEKCGARKWLRSCFPRDGPAKRENYLFDTPRGAMEEARETNLLHTVPVCTFPLVYFLEYC